MACPSYSRAAPSSEALQLTELDASYSKLPAELLKATANMELVVGLLDSSRALPINNVLSSATVTETARLPQLSYIRDRYISKVGIFRHGIMPASAEVVNNLHNFLEHMDDKEEFIELARVGEVSKMCEDYAVKAEAARRDCQALASDLASLGNEVGEQLKLLKLDGEPAASLLGPWGLLLAPGLAGPVPTAAGTSNVQVACTQTRCTEVPQVAAAHDDELAVVRQEVSTRYADLPAAVMKYAEAITAVAEFFALLLAELSRIQDKAGCMDQPHHEEQEERSFTTLFNILQRNLAQVTDLCSRYQMLVARVQIAFMKLDVVEQQRSQYQPNCSRAQAPDSEYSQDAASATKDIAEVVGETLDALVAK